MAKEKLNYVLPSLASGNTSDRALADAEHLGSDVLENTLFAMLANHVYLVGREFCFDVRFALRVFVATFFRHVLHVIGLCSFKKVVGPDAQRIIARMAHIQQRGQVATVDPKGHPVSQNACSLNVEAAILNRGTDSTACPRPTTVRILTDFTPKTRYSFFGKGNVWYDGLGHSIFTSIENGLARLGSVLDSPFRAISILGQSMQIRNEITQTRVGGY
jgi:hypothetical protein